MLDEVLTLAQKLSGVSLATLLFFILGGSYMRWWVWGSQLVELKADFEERLRKSEARGDMWQTMTLRATGLAEDGVNLAKKSVDR